MATKTVERDIFILTKTLVVNKLLDDAKSADEDDIDNLINDFDTDLIAKEETTQAPSTRSTSLTTPEPNRRVVPSDSQSKKK